MGQTKRTTPFSIGRRWFYDRRENTDYSRFWFVIAGPGTNTLGEPSKEWKLCRLEVHPDDLRDHRHGYTLHGMEVMYKHSHIKKHAVLEPIEEPTVSRDQVVVFNSKGEEKEIDPSVFFKGEEESSKWVALVENWWTIECESKLAEDAAVESVDRFLFEMDITIVEIDGKETTVRCRKGNDSREFVVMTRVVHEVEEVCRRKDAYDRKL